MSQALALKKSSNQKDNPQKLSKNRKDKESIKGAFIWLQISNYYIPSIVRVINGERLRFVSVRMAEANVLKKYLPSLHSGLLELEFVKFYLMTNNETKLFNEINRDHSDNFYGENPFTTKDYIVRFEDIYEFYEFIEFCYTKLFYNVIPDRQDKCGFIRINFKSVVPYLMIDSKKYVPLLLFNSCDKSLPQQCVQIKDWSLAYLKFCCKVQGIMANLDSSDFCRMISIDVIKGYFPPKAYFEEFWPDSFDKSQLINDDIEAKKSGCWIRKPLVVVGSVTKNTTTHSSKTPVIPQSIPVITNVQEMKENQMELSEIHQGSSTINSTDNVPQLSPSTSISLSVLNTEKNSRVANEMIDLTSPPSSPAPNNQEEKVYTPISHLQLKRKFEQMLHGSSSNNEYKELSEIHQGSSTINSTDNVPQLSPTTSISLSVLNTEKNSRVANEMIDLTSPPSSPAPNNQEEKVYTPISHLQLKRKFEQMLHGSSSNNEYKELSEIHQGSSTINSTDNVPQLSPTTSISLSVLNTEKNSRVANEMIDLTSPPSSPAPNNQEEKVYTPISHLQLKRKFEQMLHGSSSNNEYKELSEIHQGSSTINSTDNVPQLSPTTSISLSVLNTEKNSRVANEMIDLTSPPSSPAPNNQEEKVSSPISHLQLKRKFEQMLCGSSSNNEYKELSEIHQGSSTINSTDNVPQLSPSTSISLSVLNTEKNSRVANEMIDLTSPPSSPAPNNQEEKVYTPISHLQLKRKFEQMLHGSSSNNEYKELSEIHQGSSTINSTDNVPQLSPTTSISLSVLNTEKNSRVANEMIDLTSPPSSPAPNNQEEKVYTPISHLQLKRKFEQMLHGSSSNNEYKELSEIHQGSSTINSTDNVPQLSPSTSISLSVLNTEKNSRVANEMIDLTSPPSSPAPNNQEEKVSSPISAVQIKIKSEQMLHDTSKNNELLEIHQDSNTIKYTIYVPQLSPPPPPELSPFRVGKVGTQNTDSQPVIPQSVTAITNIHGVQDNQMDLAIISQGSSLMNNVSSILHLPPPPPALPIFQFETQNIEQMEMDMVDVMSPTSIPHPTTQQDTVFNPNTAIQKRKQMKGQMFHGTTRNGAYEIYKAIIHGKKIYCINSVPYCNKNLLVNLELLTREHFPMCSVERFADILINQFKITLWEANKEQLALLFIQKSNVFMNPKFRMMAGLQDINSVFLQLKSIL